MIDLKKPTKEEIAEGLKLLQKKKEYKGKVQRGKLKGTKTQRNNNQVKGRLTPR